MPTLLGPGVLDVFEILRNRFKDSDLWERMKFWGGKGQFCKPGVVPGVVLAIFLLHPNRNRQLALVLSEHSGSNPGRLTPRREHSCPQALSIHRAEQSLLRGFSTWISPGNGVSHVIFSPQERGAGVGGSCSSVCASSSFLPFSLPLQFIPELTSHHSPTCNRSLLTVFIPYSPV